MLHTADNRHFDLFFMSPEESKVLHHYLQQAFTRGGQTIFPAGENKIELNDGTTVMINLSHMLIRRNCAGYANDYRYEMVGKELNKLVSEQSGLITTFYEGIGTFKPQLHLDDSLQFKNSSRFIKVQDYTHVENSQLVEKAFANLENVFKIGRAIPYLHYKPIIQTGCTTVSMMRYFKDEGDLCSIMEDDAEGTILLSLDQRLQLSLEVIIALIRLHNMNIEHRDVKPENIMITNRLKRIKGKMIDIDFSQFFDTEDDGRRIGTPGYMAPEVVKINGRTNKYSDIYSLGKVLHFLWNDIWDLAREHHDMIFRAIALMTKDKQDERCELEDVRALFEQIIFERKLQQADKSCHELLEATRDTAIDMADLLELITVNADSNMVEDEELKKVNDKFDELLTLLIDSPLVLPIFIEFLRVPCFYGVQTKNELIEKFKKVVNEYIKGRDYFLKQYQYVNKVLNTINKSDNEDDRVIYSEALNATLERAMKKASLLVMQEEDKKYIDFHNMKKMTAKYNKEADRLTSRLALASPSKLFSGKRTYSSVKFAKRKDKPDSSPVKRLRLEGSCEKENNQVKILQF